MKRRRIERLRRRLRIVSHQGIYYKLQYFIPGLNGDFLRQESQVSHFFQSGDLTRGAEEKSLLAGTQEWPLDGTRQV